MRIHTTIRVTFNTPEHRVLEQAVLHERIAFGSPPDRKDRKRSAWEGRHLHAMGRRDIYTAEQVHAALEAAQKLLGVLTAQANLSYWERLTHHTTIRQRQSRPGGAVGLIAPGTDICAIMAEIREGQARDVVQAIEILSAAVDAVGPLPEPITANDEKYEEV